MAKLNRRNGATSNIFRVKLLDSSSTTGAGLTGLTSASSGLKISTIADVESAATTYTAAGSTIESITTLGTFAAPTATKIRFKEVDASNHPGVYEIQIADARMAVANAKSLLISISGATNLAQTDIEIQLEPSPADIRAINGDTTAPANLANAYNGTGYTDGTAQAGAAGSITLAAGASSTTDFYKGALVAIIGGTGAGQAARLITGYNGTTKVATVSPNWATPPDATSTYVTIAWGSVDLFSISGDSAACDNLEAAFDGTGYVDGTAQGGAAGSITLAASANSVTNDFYKGALIAPVGGTGGGQAARLITGYTASTRVATVYPNWAVNPDSTTTYVIIPWGALGRIYFEAMDDMLKRDLTGITGEAQRSWLNSIRFGVNKIDISGNTLTVYKENDGTPAFTMTITFNASQLPIATLDP